MALKFYGDQGHTKTYEMTGPAFKEHVIREEPVRSFRFHGHWADTLFTKTKVEGYPFGKVIPPVMGHRFAYTSTYAFTLTWTPGHMTIVGDVGELTVVHYHAMPNLKDACEWLLSSDFDYLMSKTNVQQEFDRQATIDHMWSAISEGVEEHIKNLNEEIAAWQKDKPKWRKRNGMKEADFEQEMRWWQGDDPNINYNFRKVEEPSYRVDRQYWTEDQKRGWSIPDGFDLLFKAWKFLSDECHIHFDPSELMDPDRREQLKEELENWCVDRGPDEIIGMIVRELDYDDYYGTTRYNDRNVWKMAAIQHGCRMILEQLNLERMAKDLTEIVTREVA